MALLQPDSDLSLSLLFYGSSVLRLLKHGRGVTVDDLLEKYVTQDLRRTPQSFYSALDLLFSLDAIQVTGYKVHAVRPAPSAPSVQQPLQRKLQFGDDDA